jgi:nitrate reductase cytochrome c-type subunit
MTKRKTKATPAKRSAAAKKAARTRKAVKANKEWERIYGDRPPVVPSEPQTVYDWAIANGRRDPS